MALVESLISCSRLHHPLIVGTQRPTPIRRRLRSRLTPSATAGRLSNAGTPRNRTTACFMEAAIGNHVSLGKVKSAAHSFQEEAIDCMLPVGGNVE
jgi:hypothetical protein